MNRIAKRKSHAFGKDVYLLGRDKNKKYVWLEAARWDWDWYWGFGYLKRYTQNRSPEIANDIISHSHWDSEIIGKQEHYDFEKKCWVLNSTYVHHINEHPNFIATVLTDEESWRLSELMKTFYILKETAELYHRGSAGITTDEKKNSLIVNPNEYRRINHDILPQLFVMIYDLLSPKAEG